jgi:single-stranded-DNA-specific exonuclease
LAVDLLLSDDPLRARALAGELEALNDERRRIEGAISAEAMVLAREYEDVNAHPVLVLAGEGWHPGVVGIVASRVVGRFKRPALVIGLEGTRGRGSARSVDGFDVLESMHGASIHFVRYGGHAQAAGCELERGNIGAARDAINARARAMLKDGVVEPSALWIDAELALAHMLPETMAHLDRLEPFGAQNEKPVLVALDVRLAEAPRIVGDDRTHMILKVRQGERVMKAMAFGMAARAGELKLGAALHLVYTPRWNTFRGERNLELLLLDFRVGALPVM